MKNIIPLLILSILPFCVSAQNEPLGDFEYNRDIGNPKLAGSASYDPDTQTYTITGAGYNIWGSRDEHHFLYNTLKGDFIATANFEFEGTRIPIGKLAG